MKTAHLGSFASDRLLIDSHILLWVLFEPENLKTEVRQALESADLVYVSMVSLWELTIKHTKQKLRYAPEIIIAGATEAGFALLPLRNEHLLLLPEIRLPHADPFDGLLIAQSQAERTPLVTADKLLVRSGYTVVNAEK